MRAEPPRHRGRTWRICGTALLLLIAFPRAARAQHPDSLIPAGDEYAYRGTFRGIQQWFYGHRYRSLWATPVAAPAVSFGLVHLPGLGEAEGAPTRTGALWGLTPGSAWLYRPLDRDIVAATPPPIRDNLLPSVIQGLNAARHPGAPPVVAALATAVGARVAPSLLIRLGDSAVAPQGAGRLGYLEQMGFEGVTTVEAIDSLRRDGGRDFDARAYLRERLFDTYIGHWDDTPGDWRWQRADDTAPWSPGPRDRDRAFARYDGLLADIARKRVPGFVSFGQGYQSQLGVMPYQRTLDRQLLSLLDWPVWDSLAGALQASLTDSVIAAAVSALPPEYLALDREPLTAGLLARRDSLRVAARGLYRLVNQEAAFFGSPGPDTVTVTRSPDGGFELAFQGGLHRRYAPEETDAVALYLGGGADQVELVGPGNVGPLLDLAWEPGLTVKGGRRSGQRTTLYGGGTRVAKLRMEFVGDTLPVPGVQDLDLLRPRPVPLHGSDTEMVTWFDVNSDVGVLIGGGVAITTYRLGHDPYYRKLRIRAGYATAVGDYAVEVHGDFHRWRSPAGLTLDAGISEIAVLHFFGYGNTTPFTQPVSYYLARQKQLYLYPAWNYRMTPHTLVAVGPVFKHVRTDTVGNHLINDSRPYGVPEFAQAGVLATATYDTRDTPSFTRTGWRIVAGGAAYPVVFGAGSPFGTMQASAAWYVTLPSVPRLTLATRASARLVMGDVPVHEAAFIGGSTTVRGYEAGRYAGESSAYLNGELRAHLATFPAVVPWQFGVMGLADLGRVFNATDDTNVWHGSAGGGVWFSMPDRSLGSVLTVAWSPQGSSIWLGIGGFMF